MGKETILVVEDNQMNRKLVETVLRPGGYRLLIALDGEEAISMATREQPDLILMDLKLPKLDGYQAIQRLKSQSETAHIPVIALTAYALPEERERARAAGCDAYITKPIDTRRFPDQVRQHLDLRAGEKAA